MTDYLIEIMKARKKFNKKHIEFNEVLDKWEDEHEKMGRFVVGLDWRDKSYKTVRLQFIGKVNSNVIDLLCKEFNLQVMERKTIKNYYADSYIRTEFRLMHKDYPFGYTEN